VITADRTGVITLVRHFVAHLAATMSAATFVVAALVALKGLAALAAGELAARIGALMQFVCVAAVLCFALAIPHVLRSGSFTDSLAAAPWFPNGWFLGIFEILRGSSQPDIALLAWRGVAALVIATVAAVLVSVFTVRYQLRAALAPAGSIGPSGSARISRLAARAIVGRSRDARAIADFIVLTLARNRTQQAPVATAAAIGFAIAMAGLSRAAGELSSLTHPRTIVLWTPLVIGFWIAIGTRHAYFVPTELPAAWTLRANGAADCVATWKAVGAALMAAAAIPAIAVAGAVDSDRLAVRADARVDLMCGNRGAGRAARADSPAHSVHEALSTWPCEAEDAVAAPSHRDVRCRLPRPTRTAPATPRHVVARNRRLYYRSRYVA
jgi:hypothetical protein